MATILFESFSSSATASTSVATLTRRLAQSFTPQQSHTIEQVILNLYCTTNVNSPTVATVEIQSDNENKPSGTVLASGTSNVELWQATTWLPITFVLDLNPKLLIATKYWIVLKCSGVDTGHYIEWKRDSAGTYAGGCYGNSTNSGATWTINTDNDWFFEEWGTLTASLIKGFRKIRKFRNNPRYSL